MSELQLRTCASISGGWRSRLFPDGPRVHLSGPAYMPSCIRLEVRLPLDRSVLCSDYYKNADYYV